MAAALAYNFSANLSGFAICLAAAFCGSFGGSRLCGLRIDEEFSSTCLSDGAIRFCSIALRAAKARRRRLTLRSQRRASVQLCVKRRNNARADRRTTCRIVPVAHREGSWRPADVSEWINRPLAAN